MYKQQVAQMNKCLFNNFVYIYHYEYGFYFRYYRIMCIILKIELFSAVFTFNFSIIFN